MVKVDLRLCSGRCGTPTCVPALLAGLASVGRRFNLAAVVFPFRSGSRSRMLVCCAAPSSHGGRCARTWRCPMKAKLQSHSGLRRILPPWRVVDRSQHMRMRDAHELISSSNGLRLLRSSPQASQLIVFRVPLASGCVRRLILHMYDNGKWSMNSGEARRASGVAHCRLRCWLPNGAALNNTETSCTDDSTIFC